MDWPQRGAKRHEEKGFEREDEQRQSSPLPVPFQSGIEDLLRHEKRSLLKLSNSCRQIDQTLFRGKLQERNGENCWNTQGACSSTTVHVVHQDGVRAAFKSKLQCLCLALVQSSDGPSLRYVRYLKPRTGLEYPSFHLLWSSWMDQFVPNSERDENLVKKIGQDLRAIDQDEIMKGTSVGNDDAAHLFRYAAKMFEV